MKTIDRVILTTLALSILILAAVLIASPNPANAYHGLSRHDVEHAMRSVMRQMQPAAKQQPDIGQEVRTVLQNCTITGNFIDNEESGDSTDFVARLVC